MIHKIQTAGNYYVSLEVKTVKGIPCLCISKDTSLLTFNRAETNQLNAIIQSIDATNYMLKEYGSVNIGSESFKVFISEFRGIKSFQIRQWTVSPTYSGFGKLGITLPTYKIKELHMHMKTVMQEL
ncbi:MAG: hypothetical protein NT085_00225 [candidate division SR1 bacterium]|nr:hypothetical protein [candidate division SR1 bacterium]